MPVFPETLLRGIPKKDKAYFDNEGNPTVTVFRPSEDQLKNPDLSGFTDISINWEDNSEVEKFTLETLSSSGDGTFHFKGGTVRLSLDKLEIIKNDVNWAGKIDYRRDDPPLTDNIYHGDLLLANENLKTSDNRKAILGRLSFAIIKYIHPH